MYQKLRDKRGFHRPNIFAARAAAPIPNDYQTGLARSNKAQFRIARAPSLPLSVSVPLSFLAGFLIVAACVMTFEARDNAAKVVPSTGCSQMEERKSARKLKVNHPTLLPSYQLFISISP